MRCPIDNETLVMSDRNGVEIDYCPKCRGVWLDRGELDKIIDRVGAGPAATQPSAAQPDMAPRGGQSAAPQEIPRPARETSRDTGRRRDDDDDDYDDRGRRPYRKRESFLSELFDF